MENVIMFGIFVHVMMMAINGDDKKYGKNEM